MQEVALSHQPQSLRLTAMKFEKSKMLTRLFSFD